MFRLEEPTYLFYLPIVLIALGLAYYAWEQRKIKIASLGNSEVVGLLIKGISKKKWWIKNGIFAGALFFGILALVNPQTSGKMEQVESKSANVFIALDISNSMLANDIVPNRLERAKRLTRNIIRSLKGNRIGFIVFAGGAYLQSPLTTDFSAIEMMVATANVQQAGTQGTAIGEAVSLASKSLDQDDHPGVLIVITDGETHDTESLQMVEAAHEKGHLLYAIGVGTPDGGTIPENNGRTIRQKLDEEGNVVVTKLNIPYLKDLANAGGGKAYVAQQEQDAIDDIRDGISKFEKTEQVEQSFRNFINYFYVSMLISISLLVVYFFWDTIFKLK